MKFGRVNKKLGVSIIAAMAICGLVMTPLVSKASKAVLQPTTSVVVSQNNSVNSTTQNTDTDKASKYEDDNGNMKRIGEISDEDIDIDMLRYQLGDTPVIELKSSTDVLQYLSDRNSVSRVAPKKITSVDNSKSKYFPKIDTQGSLNTKCDGPRSTTHRVTIVGYDDNIWVDMNHNGCIEEGEKGAFKIANSWGTEYDNDGFLWMSYDSLNKVSSVKDSENFTMVSDLRVRGLFDVVGFTVDTDISDNDCFAALELESDSAYQNRLVITATDKDGNVVGKYKPVPFYGCHLMYSVGEYPYNGYNSDHKGEFYIDLSNVVKDVNKDTINDYNWYVTVVDAILNESNIKVNNAKLYISSEDRYIDTDWSEPVTIDYNYKTFKTINPEIPDNFTETEVYFYGSGN